MSFRALLPLERKVNKDGMICFDGNQYSVPDGPGVPKDYVQAYAWFNIAAAQGHEKAHEFLPEITKEMTTADITKAQELSREYWEAYGPNRASSE